MNNKHVSEAFAEVIESSLDTFTAQSWTWDTFPAFGSLAYVQNNTCTIFGCVTSIKTGSMDPQRYPFPYQKTEEELKAEQPQIFEFLKTTFEVKILGYKKEENKIDYALPSMPAKIHAFVYPSPPQLTVTFFNDPNFLHLLFSSQSTITHFDDLLLAIFKQLHAYKKLTNKTLNTFCQKFSLLTGNDYRRMKLFLQRVESLV